jgi:hypothetical protein
MPCTLAKRESTRKGNYTTDQVLIEPKLGIIKVPISINRQIL